MSLTLGEKLREAREARGISLSEVAEQTRISSLYLESIEHDDYRNLPGGIFNKGFVKSFAKYVGINEQEALADYTRLIAGTEDAKDPELKLYKPEVLTDDYRVSSMMPTVIAAIIILAIMSGGVYLLVSYLRPSAAPTANIAAANTANTVNTSQSPTVSSDTPSMATLKVEFKATTEPVSLSATNDGKLSSNVVPAGSTETFEPKESLKLSYSRSLAQAVQLTINGKNIALPSVPLSPKRNTIEFEINKDNLGQIWHTASISGDAPPANPGTPALMGTPLPAGPSPVKPATTPAPKPNGAANAAANAAVKPPLSNTAKPPSMTGKPPRTAKPTPKPQ